jgi:hypothetical protein
MITKGQKPQTYSEIRNAYAQQTTDAARQAYLRSQMDRVTQSAWRCAQVLTGNEWEQMSDSMRDRLFDQVRGIVTP